MSMLLAVGSSVAGSFIIGETIWRGLECLANRLSVTYNAKMTALQQQFFDYAKKPLGCEPQLETTPWSERKLSKLLPQCPHSKESNPNYFASSWRVAPCHINEQICFDQRNKIREAAISFGHERDELVGIPTYEIKWVITALCIGFAAAILSTICLLPSRTPLSTKAKIVLLGGVLGTMSAASTSLIRTSSETH